MKKTSSSQRLNNPEKSVSENDKSSLTEIRRMVSFATKVTGTVVVIFGWLAFIVLYLAFFAGDFDFWQKFAVFIASGAIVFGVIAVAWISWMLGNSVH